MNLRPLKHKIGVFEGYHCETIIVTVFGPKTIGGELLNFRETEEIPIASFIK